MRNLSKSVEEKSVARGIKALPPSTAGPCGRLGKAWRQIGQVLVKKEPCGTGGVTERIIPDSFPIEKEQLRPPSVDRKEQ